MRQRVAGLCKSLHQCGRSPAATPPVDFLLLAVHSAPTPDIHQQNMLVYRRTSTNRASDLADIQTFDRAASPGRSLGSAAAKPRDRPTAVDHAASSTSPCRSGPRHPDSFRPEQRLATRGSQASPGKRTPGSARPHNWIARLDMPLAQDAGDAPPRCPVQVGRLDDRTAIEVPSSRHQPGSGGPPRLQGAPPWRPQPASPCRRIPPRPWPVPRRLARPRDLRLQICDSNPRLRAINGDDLGFGRLTVSRVAQPPGPTTAWPRPAPLARISILAVRRACRSDPSKFRWSPRPRVASIDQNHLTYARSPAIAPSRRTQGALPSPNPAPGGRVDWRWCPP